MKFKINLIFFIFLLNIGFTFAQEIAIPYRDGNKWGMCNQEGEIIIIPKYDKLEFQQDYSINHEIVIPKIKDKRGLISNGRVLFEAIYENVYEINGIYVLVSENNNVKQTNIVTLEGKSILKKPIIQIISSETCNASSTLFHLLNADFTESVFIYDSHTKSIACWLYEDYYSISILERQNNMKGVVFALKKAKTDALIIENWDFSKLPKEKIKTKLTYKTERDYFNRFVEKSHTYSDTYGTGSGTGSGNYRYDEVVVMEDRRGDPIYDVQAAEVPPIAHDGSNTYTPPTYYTHSFKRVDNQLVFEKSNQYNSKELKKSIPVDLKIPISAIEIKSYYNTTRHNDTIDNYQNFIIYKKRNKQGLLFTSDSKQAVEFDTICKTFVTLNSYSDASSEVVFIVGQKEAKTNHIKYSFYSNIKGLLFSFQYDELLPLKMYTNQGNISYQSRIGKKIGIVQMNGKELLMPQYDEIKQLPQSSSGHVTKLYQLRRNNKFGIIFQNTNTQKIEVIDAVFDYEIGEIYLNYPKTEYKKSTELNATVSPKITLLSLKDKYGNLKGYAISNSTLYYKN